MHVFSLKTGASPGIKNGGWPKLPFAYARGAHDRGGGSKSHFLQMLYDSISNISDSIISSTWCVGVHVSMGDHLLLWVTIFTKMVDDFSRILNLVGELSPMASMVAKPLLWWSQALKSIAWCSHALYMRRWSSHDLIAVVLVMLAVLRSTFGLLTRYARPATHLWTLLISIVI